VRFKSLPEHFLTEIDQHKQALLSMSDEPRSRDRGAGDGSSTLFTSLTGLSSLFLLFDNDGHELAVTDEGLRVDSSMTPWDDLGSYRVTDEELKIERARWWLPSRDFDREEIGDDAAFIDALGEYLPRTDETTAPAVATTDR